MTNNNIPKVLQGEIQYENLFFFQKADVLYCQTFYFVKRFLPASHDRTVDQMVQAARSGKQNIVEGLADGMTSTEMQLKLLNVARASLKELKADYEDYINTRHLTAWNDRHPRYDSMLHFCRTHNKRSDYEPYFELWNAEEHCNIAITLLHMTDRMMITFLKGLEQQFITQGGIRERMYAARTGYRKGQEERLLQLEQELPKIQQMLLSEQKENAMLREQNKVLRQKVPILEQQIELLMQEKRHLEVLLQQLRSKR